MLSLIGSSLKFQDGLATLLMDYMAVTDLLGRLHIMQVVQKKTGIVHPAIATTSAIPKFADKRVMGFETVPNREAIDYLANLTPVTRRLYDGLKAQYKQQAFTVAHVTDTRVIEAIQKEIQDILNHGGTERDFAKAVEQLTSDANVEALTELHVETVFRTNVQSSYMTGRLEQMRNQDSVDALPYWEYSAVLDDRTRENHAAMDGFVARWDDPVWKIWYPPAGFNCRCTVYPILADEAPDVADTPGTERIRAYPDEGFGGLGGLL